MKGPLNETNVRDLLLKPDDTAGQIEPKLMTACSVELILQLDQITMLPTQSQRMVATTALLNQVKQETFSDK